MVELVLFVILMQQDANIKIEGYWCLLGYDAAYSG
jgi:hypothetical protein